MSEQYFTRPNVQPVITYIGTTPEQRQMSTDEFKAKFDEMTVNLQNYIKETLLTELDAFKQEFMKLLAGGTQYSATLQEGWTGTLTYRKNDLGQVVLSGNIIAGNAERNVLICTLPSGYRPKNALAVPAYNSTKGRVNTLFELSATGNMYLRPEDISIIQTGDNIHIHIIFSTI